MANRLAKEDSPYLQQHEHDPVHWWPWCDEALQKAKKENKALFISIGYSSSRWCHAMQEGVFKNKECADILNEGFISIKVDSQEHPDIGKYYQEAYQLLNNRAGGWPTSIFCTPDNKPFFARTYLPAESIPGSNEGMGFKEIANIISAKVKENDSKLLETAQEVDSFINRVEHPKEATVLKEAFAKNFMLQAKNNFDENNGGFSLKPKFPHVATLRALLAINKLNDDMDAKEMLLRTLNMMKKGGFYDLVDGGFCRYSTDEKWLAPHFEKTLYDNALLSALYADAYLAYQDDSYLQIAKECADFWHNFMSEDNLFYSASDAHSEGEQGTYFTYAYEEVYACLVKAGYENARQMCSEMSLTRDGNFEGKNIIRFENATPQWFGDAKILLSKIRASRNYPFIDKKVQTSWSSMMIDALFKLGAIDDAYKQRAIKSIDALLKVMYVNGKLYHAALIHKTPKVEAFLEDYAFLTQALLSAFKHTGDETHLINAQRFANKALEEFYDKGAWNFSVGEFATKAQVNDNTYASCVSVMVENLLSLTALLDDEKYKRFAFKTMEYNSYELGRKPIYAPYMLTQALRYLKGDRAIKSTL